MKKYFLFLILMVASGCATAQSYTKNGIDFKQFKKVAVVKLDCSNSAVGQEVADIVAFAFIKKGYNVIERSQLRSITDENALISSGLTETNKSALKLAGINAIIVGSVSRYDCQPDKVFAMIGLAPIVLNTNNCHASLSLKMLDVNSGDILWMANGANSKNDSNMTAHKVLQTVLELIEEKIP